MKKLLAASVVILFVLGSCVKSDTKCPYNDSTDTAPASEKQALQDSLTAHGIQATAHPSGFFYTISNQGTGQAVTNLCSNVTVAYKGAFLNGHIFDSTKTGEVATFQLGRVLVGWQKGIPLISKGGDITLYIPPSLGYGSKPYPDNGTDPVVIPANSNLIFTVHIQDIQ